MGHYPAGSGHAFIPGLVPGEFSLVSQVQWGVAGMDWSSSTAVAWFSGLCWLSRPQQVSPAGTFWQCCRWVKVGHTTKSSLLSLSARGWEADILAVVRHPYISSCTCPSASTESETAAATAKNAHLSFQETAITITTKLCIFAWCGLTMQECAISLEVFAPPKMS